MKEKSAAQINLGKLPAQCFGILLSTKEIIRIVAGESGYYAVNQPANLGGETAEEFVDRLNDEDGVTKAQRAAMEAGSMFGWGTPSANPDIYSEAGEVDRAKLVKEAR